MNLFYSTSSVLSACFQCTELTYIYKLALFSYLTTMYSSFKVYAGTLRSKSHGYVKLKSLNPYEHPVINPNYLSTEQDRVELREAVYLTREIFNQVALDPFRGKELQPGIISASQRFIISCNRTFPNPFAFAFFENKFSCEIIHIEMCSSISSFPCKSNSVLQRHKITWKLPFVAEQCNGVLYVFVVS